MESMNEFILDLETARKEWQRLGDIPINENEELDECFTALEGTDFESKFDVGTDMYYVWHWFEDTFDISVAKDLMNLK